MNSRGRTIKQEFRKNNAICERVVTLLHLISNKARFRIVCLLSRGEFCVHDIMAVVNEGKLSHISQQLMILRLAGIMKKLLMLGAGTAGTMMANRLRRRTPADQWTITIVDQYPKHYYQPGFLFMPFGIYSEKDVIKPKRKFIRGDVRYVEAKIDRIDPENNRVFLESGEHVDYDVLIIATGVKTAPDQVEGMLGDDWRRRVFDFYTFEGASRLHDALRNWNGGKLVVHISEMPIKCPVAPLEFAFLADWWLAKRGLREKTHIAYVTPLSVAFTKPIASKVLGHLLDKKRINVVTDFNIARVDNEQHKIVSWDEKEVD